jgi:hypothetical protein
LTQAVVRITCTTCPWPDSRVSVSTADCGKRTGSK